MMTCCGNLKPLTAIPPAPGGELPAGTDVGNLLQWDGAAWIPVVIPTDEGQIIAWDADTNQWIAEGAPSADGQVLVWNAAAEEWVASGGGGALPAAGADGSILVSDGGVWTVAAQTRLLEWGALTAGNAASPTIRYLQYAGSSVAAGSTEAVSQREAQFSGTIRKLRVVIFTALATNITVTLRINSIADATFVVTLVAGAIVGEVAGSVPVLAGDLLSIQTVTVAADATNSGIKAYLLVDTP